METLWNFGALMIVGPIIFLVFVFALIMAIYDTFLSRSLKEWVFYVLTLLIVAVWLVSFGRLYSWFDLLSWALIKESYITYLPVVLSIGYIGFLLVMDSHFKRREMQ